MDIKMQIVTLILTTSLIGQQSCENYFKYADLEAPQRDPGGHENYDSAD